MMTMFAPSIANGLSEEEAVQTFMGFSKRPEEEAKSRDSPIFLDRRFDKLSDFVRGQVHSLYYAP